MMIHLGCGDGCSCSSRSLLFSRSASCLPRYDGDFYDVVSGGILSFAMWIEKSVAVVVSIRDVCSFRMIILVTYDLD